MCTDPHRVWPFDHILQSIMRPAGYLLLFTYVLNNMVILDTRTVCICCAQNMNIVNIVLKKIQSNYNKVLNNTEAVVLTENTEDRCIVQKM